MMESAKADVGIGGCDAVARGVTGAARSRIPMIYGEWLSTGDVEVDVLRSLIEG